MKTARLYFTETHAAAAKTRRAAAAALFKGEIEMTKYVINIEGFTVHISKTDEGLSVDVFDREALQNADVDPIASTWALDSELEGK